MIKTYPYKPNFSGKFFNNSKYQWKSSLYNANLIIKNAIYHNNLYDLLLNHPFNEDLNLHRSVQSLENQNENMNYGYISPKTTYQSNFYNSNFETSTEYFQQLNISNFLYDTVILSAICYILKNTYLKYEKNLEVINIPPLFRNENINDPQVKRLNYEAMLKKQASSRVCELMKSIKFYLFYEKYSSKFFDILKNTNIFYCESNVCIKAFIYSFGKIFSKNDEYSINILDIKPNTIRKFFYVFDLYFLINKSFTKNAVNSYDIKELMNIFYIYNKFNLCVVSFKNLEEGFSFQKSFLYNQKFFISCFFAESIFKAAYVNFPDEPFNLATIIKYRSFIDKSDLLERLGDKSEFLQDLFPSIKINIQSYTKKEVQKGKLGNFWKLYKKTLKSFF